MESPGDESSSRRTLHGFRGVKVCELSIIYTKPIWSQVRLKFPMHDSSSYEGTKLDCLPLLGVDKEKFIEELRRSH